MPTSKTPYQHYLQAKKRVADGTADEQDEVIASMYPKLSDSLTDIVALKKKIEALEADNREIYASLEIATARLSGIGKKGSFNLDNMLKELSSQA